MNHTLLQYFEWYLPEDAQHWDRLIRESSSLAQIGYDRLWLPPAYKGQGGRSDVGYGVYDMYDLGEFDQKGTVPTKYGTKDAYLRAIQTAHEHHLEIIADIVFNHRMGADGKEVIKAKEISWADRDEAISDEEEVEVWTRFTFPGRNKKYSDFTWDWSCFTGTDYDARTKETKLLEFYHKQWAENVSQENGNYDYILDAVKSIDAAFFPGWLNAMRQESQDNLFAVGEYWSGDIQELKAYLVKVSYSMLLFDVPLHFHLYDASRSYDRYDMSKILDGTLTQEEPQSAVAFVDNHDTQPGQALQSWVEDWFKVHAYALILLRDSVCPCVFYGDHAGIPKDGKAKVSFLNEMVWIRKHLLDPETIEDRFDDPHCIGWCVQSEHPIVVVMTNGWAGVKEFKLTQTSEMVDITDPSNRISLEDGKGKFLCKDGKCSIYISKEDYEWMKEDLKI